MDISVSVSSSMPNAERKWRLIDACIWFLTAASSSGIGQRLRDVLTGSRDTPLTRS
jgi:hypothetical protein